MRVAPLEKPMHHVWLLLVLRQWRASRRTRRALPSTRTHSLARGSVRKALLEMLYNNLTFRSLTEIVDVDQDRADREAAARREHGVADSPGSVDLIKHLVMTEGDAPLLAQKAVDDNKLGDVPASVESAVADPAAVGAFDVCRDETVRSSEPSPHRFGHSARATALAPSPLQPHRPPCTAAAAAMTSISAAFSRSPSARYHRVHVQAALGGAAAEQDTVRLRHRMSRLCLGCASEHPTMAFVPSPPPAPHARALLCVPCESGLHVRTQMATMGGGTRIDGSRGKQFELREAKASAIVHRPRPHPQHMQARCSPHMAQCPSAPANRVWTAWAASAAWAATAARATWTARCAHAPTP